MLVARMKDAHPGQRERPFTEKPPSPKSVPNTGGQITFSTTIWTYLEISKDDLQSNLRTGL